MLILAAGLVVAGFRLYLILRTKAHIRTVTEAAEDSAAGDKADAIIVLGAGVWENRQPSPMLKNRLETALALWKAGVADRILVTGDHRPGEYDEVDVMWEYLVVKNVPEEKIERDYAGFSTYESMVRSGQKYGIKRGVVVTQHYHLYRAMYIGEKNGIETTGVIAEDAGDLFGRAKRILREWAATIKDIYYCTVKKEISR